MTLQVVKRRLIVPRGIVMPPGAIAAPGGSPVVFDAANADTTNTLAQLISLSHTSTGSNRGVVVFAYALSSFASFIDGSATYGGTAMTRIFQGGDASNYYAAFRLHNQNTGAQTVQVNFTAEDCDTMAIAVISATNVNQTTPVGTHQNTSAASGTTPSLTVTSLDATNGLIVDGLFAWGAAGAATMAVGANQTSRATDSIVAAFRSQIGCSSQASSDGGAMTWTKDSGSDYYYSAVEFKPV